MKLIKLFYNLSIEQDGRETPFWTSDCVSHSGAVLKKINDTSLFIFQVNRGILSELC